MSLITINIYGGFLKFYLKPNFPFDFVIILNIKHTHGHT